jgi:hypothetical protein
LLPSLLVSLESEVLLASELVVAVAVVAVRVYF